MERICEPELMDAPLQAQAYAQADFASSDQALLDGIADQFGADLGDHIVDLGCGPGNITFLLADRYPNSLVLGIDGAAAMLEIAEARRQSKPHWHQAVRFRQAVLPCADLQAGSASAVVSNSLLHHLHDPQVLWQTVHQLGSAGAVVVVRDLHRPETVADLEALVAAQMVDAPVVLRADYAHSLRAAFCCEEVEEQLRLARLNGLTVARVGDRYLEVSGRLPLA
ncbi:MULTISPECIES: trans-aconitate 2-methyltransferase [Synechococcaceae]|uniref:class I SAM-dependent methyltransferase n=1 Tax=Synechococcaceae TaxID=1890426 RepID=UPI0008FF13D3|nr:MULTISPECIES: class I SAM-dependent methyltransferase [Synechococcaceae]MCT4363477.1 class I SAM-dependent methyltransferase [Candidatus Regnicoccus frigidus MAG-AL1]APD48455.1 SAM-dependent methyltransferase [Synechococcus sp. SynAce01]MCT0203289.1 class I SAM-dependent methyltransferase [Synechococcus sp. CS-603]MCT4367972.1 class I SAM-dependent methyltransferase [Candidatus Regnicoccus frigidus MAG-AL2]TWB85966.1 methyltransferase family protein [Synechococcus sp. Ace-Pa]